MGSKRRTSANVIYGTAIEQEKCDSNDITVIKVACRVSVSPTAGFKRCISTKVFVQRVKPLHRVCSEQFPLRVSCKMGALCEPLVVLTRYIIRSLAALIKC